MKYKLINLKTKEEHFCDKVTIDGFDYYLSDEKPDKERETYMRIDTGLLFNSLKGSNPDIISKYCRIVVATTNPNIDIPKVVDEVEVLANIEYPFAFGGIGNIENTSKNHFIKGYNKSQQTHPFSEEDMIEFNEFSIGLLHKQVTGVKYYDYDAKWITTKELLQIWKEQKVKNILYE